MLPALTERRKKEQALFLKPADQDIQAASVGNSHVQLNYQPWKTYGVVVDGLRIRTKLASQKPGAVGLRGYGG